MILGIEGGGSQTRIISEQGMGDLSFRQFDVSLKYRDLGIETSAERLAAILAEHYEAPDAIAIALSGASDIRDQDAFRARLAERLQLAPRRIHIESDSTLALAACPATTENKILLIAGTGSVCIGSDTRAVVHSVGGWGPLVGDEGSGRAIGRSALVHLTRVLDGRERSSKLSDALRALIGMEGDRLIAFLKSADLQPATYARVVFETESEHCEQILEDAAHDLAQLVQAVLLRIAANAERPRELFLSGSIAKSEKVMSSLKRHLPLMQMSPLNEDAPARTLLEIARSLAVG